MRISRIRIFSDGSSGSSPKCLIMLYSVDIPTIFLLITCWRDDGRAANFWRRKWMDEDQNPALNTFDLNSFHADLREIH